MTFSAIQDAYRDKSGDEWDRLISSPIRRVEYLVTNHCLERHLPPSGLILDAGCGPGRYARDLAGRGYRVVLYDLVREMLLLGRQKIKAAGTEGQISGFIEGDIVSMPYGPASFDASISLGAPLSHFVAAEARQRAVTEMARVTKPGGTLLITGLSRIASYRGMVYWMNPAFIDQHKSGVIRDQGLFSGWIDGYSFLPGELRELVQNTGMEIIEEVGCESLADHLPLEHLEQIEADPELWPYWRDILIQYCNEPSVIGISNHLLVAARKPAT